MSGRGTGVLALLALIVAVPVLAVLMLAVLFQDEQDRAATSCTGPAPGSGGGDLLAPPGSFVKPVKPETVTLTSPFGARWGQWHNGIDLAGPMYTPIYAAADGVVRNAGAASGFGQWVVLDHQVAGQLVSTVYGHIESFTVRVGQQVRAGQQIAEMGSRGQSSGPHLHFEIHPGGWNNPVDPQAQYEAAPAPGDRLHSGRAELAAANTGRSAPPGGMARVDLAQPVPASAGSERGLQVDTKRLMRALHARFGERLGALGGWRADGGAASDHPQGRAVDAMIPDHTSGPGVALGDEVADYVLAHAGFFRVQYLIWRQTYYVPGQAPSAMGDRGSPTQNHYDHVHITVHPSTFDEVGAAWGSAPGGVAVPGSGATSAQAGCTVGAADTVGDHVAPGSVPPQFLPWLERAGSLCPQITPSLLAAQIQQESGFRKHGHNSSGAAGYTQFIDETWAVYGHPVDEQGSPAGPAGAGDRNSIGDAVMAQGRYMCAIARIVDRWIAEGTVADTEGREELYLAGYNAGEGAVLTAGGFPRGGDYTTQTRPYADIILAAEPRYRAVGTR